MTFKIKCTSRRATHYNDGKDRHLGSVEVHQTCETCIRKEAVNIIENLLKSKDEDISITITVDKYDSDLPF